MQILRQRTQCSLAKQQIDILQRNLIGLLEEEEDDGERNDNVECYEYEVEFVAELVKPDGADLREQRRDEPVSNASGESVSASADLHRHDFGHVHPGNGAEGEGEDDRDQEEKEDAANGEAAPRAILVLRVEDTLTDQGECNTDGAEEERPAAADAIKDEDDED